MQPATPDINLHESIKQIESISLPDLEKLKLYTEINAKETEAKAVRTGSVRRNLQSWVAVLAAIGTMVGVYLSFWSDLSELVREKRLQGQIKLTDQMIDIVSKLDSNKQNERDNALLMLGYFKIDSVPILLSHLERTEAPEVAIRSLQLIKRNIDNPTDVTNELLRTAKQIFAIQDVRRDDIDNSYRNYIQALGELGAERSDNSKQILMDLQEDLRAKEPKRLYLEEKKPFMKDAIKEALKKIQSATDTANRS